MSWRGFLIGGLMAAGLAAEARACSIWVEPRLPGESRGAYRQRVAALAREAEALRPQREAQALRHRQAVALEQAAAIFIARSTYLPRPTAPDGRPMPREAIDPFIRHFRPVAWLRGPRADALFPVQVGMTSCGGFTSIGDVRLGGQDEEFVFFARGGPLSMNTLIDAIAVDRVTDPALIAFVAQFRRH